MTQAELNTSPQQDINPDINPDDEARREQYDRDHDADLYQHFHGRVSFVMLSVSCNTPTMAFQFIVKASMVVTTVRFY
jgi:hypothetical protein